MEERQRHESYFSSLLLAPVVLTMHLANTFSNMTKSIAMHCRCSRPVGRHFTQQLLTHTMLHA